MSEVEDYDDGPKGDEMEQDSDDAASVGSHSEQDGEEQQHHHDSEVGSDVASEPASAPQSPSGSERGQQSEDEVHISEQEEYEQSDKEDAHSDKNEEQSGKEDRESDVDGERDDDEDQELAQDVESDKDHSDREDEQSSDRDEQQEEKEGEDDDNRDKEDSDREGSVPEIHIDSGDEYNDRESINKNSDDDDDRQSNSGSEVERDEGSDADKGSDQDEANRSQVMDATSDAEENNDPGSEDERNSEISGRESPVEETPRSPSPPPDSDDEDEKETKAESDDEEVPSSPVPFEDKMEISTEEMDRADNRAKSDSESDSDSDESKVGELIADIFGKSDDEEEEFEGFGEEDLAAVKQKKEKRKKAAKALSDSEEEVEIEEKENAEVIEEIGETEELPPPATEIEDSEAAPKKVAHAVSDDDSDDDGLRKMREGFVSDFDLMMQKKKEENQRKRKRKDVDIINDSDDLIAEIILQMRQAADEDRELNKQRKAATKKLKILPLVMSQLKKQDLKMAFLDQGVLNVMADWLSPLPDRSLPHFQIREGMIRRLGEFPIIDQSLLKCSGVGRALMYLYKHPKETKENRERCGKLITEWARPIFNLTTNFHSLTKEEREQRDFEHLPRKRKSRMESGEEEEQEKAGARKDIEKVMSSEEKSLRPGEKGWIARARVPAPSMRDYVVRPKWNVEIEIGRGPGKKPLNRYEKHLRTLMEKKKLKKAQRAVTISIEGRKMAI